MACVLFLSHAGIDTDAAKALKARILAAPVARDNGLGVWFDKDDLDAGKPWQSQIETAIERSHAFAVYVGSKGVVNWVDAEVRLALNRTITEPDYRFISASSLRRISRVRSALAQAAERVCTQILDDQSPANSSGQHPVAPHAPEPNLKLFASLLGSRGNGFPMRSDDTQKPRAQNITQESC
jgi:TIR domain